MGPLIVRIALVATGLGAVEIGLVTAVGHQGPMGWLWVAVGLVLLVAGSAGFMGPLFGGPGKAGRGR